MQKLLKRNIEFQNVFQKENKIYIEMLIKLKHKFYMKHKQKN